MEHLKVDLCVIGAGSGGLSVAAGAVQMGASVVLIEGHKMGGDCLNYGCVPSKALLAAAKRAAAFNGGLGVAAADPQIDFAGVKDHIRSVIAEIEPHDSQRRFEGLGVRVIRDWARFVSPTQVQAGETRVTARRFVVATGSSPLVPRIPGLEGVPYLTNETIFDLRERPDHLVVIGGGPIGIEMAQAHRRLGCEVTVIEAMAALGREDQELSRTVLDRVRAEGVDIVENTSVATVSAQTGTVTVETEDGRTFTGSHLLLAAGRKVNLERLDLDKAGVKHDRAGIKVGPALRSSNRRVYAVGDAAGGAQFTHVAGYHAGIVIRNAMFGLPAKARTDHIPRVTYTDPELAQVGLTEAEARKRHGPTLKVVRAAFADNDRARAEGRTEGMIKVMIVRGRPVGASIVGPNAGELIAPFALMMANRMKMSALANTVLPYPTLAEIGKRAAGAYFSPKLFDSPMVKRVVRLVQRFVP